MFRHFGKYFDLFDFDFEWATAAQNDNWDVCFLESTFRVTDLLGALKKMCWWFGPLTSLFPGLDQLEISFWIWTGTVCNHNIFIVLELLGPFGNIFSAFCDRPTGCPRTGGPPAGFRTYSDHWENNIQHFLAHPIQTRRLEVKHCPRCLKHRKSRGRLQKAPKRTSKKPAARPPQKQNKIQSLWMHDDTPLQIFLATSQLFLAPFFPDDPKSDVLMEIKWGGAIFLIIIWPPRVPHIFLADSLGLLIKWSPSELKMAGCI